MGDLWHLGLAGWVLQDGGYPDIHVGDQADFSVEIWDEALQPAPAAREGSEASLVQDNAYRVTGRLHTRGHLSVLDLGGLQVWREGPAAMHHDLGDQAERGPEAVEGTVRLAISSLVGPAPSMNPPPLDYEWEVVGIEVATGPWVPHPDGGLVRDAERMRWRRADRTRMWEDEPDTCPEYLVHCRLLSSDPKRGRRRLGPFDPVAVRRRSESSRRPLDPPEVLMVTLLAAYDEPHRGYHDAVHLAEVLENLDRLGCQDHAVLLAAWFHDAVYTGSPDDEERSAAWAEQALAAEPELAAEVGRLVRLTATHRPEPGDVAGQLLCDADLAILAAWPGRYAAYTAGVRAEYAHVSDADFRAGRRAVLADLLAKDHLFETWRGREDWERRARRNLKAELAALS